MNKKENLIIYPFDIQSTPLLRNEKFLEQYNITALISPKGWGFDGKDGSCADKGENINIDVSSNFEEALELADTVLFSESYLSLDFRKMVYPKIEKAVKSNKNIICTLDIEKEICCKLENECRKRDKYFKNYKNDHDIQYKKYEKIKKESIYEISTPVMFIVGMGERTQKFQLQLSVREYIVKMGYKVSQIGTRHYCEMFGFHSFPQFMFGNSMSEVEKIVAFNLYVKKLEIEEQPDLIIIGIPGGLLPFNNMFTNRFGALAYEISRSIRPDVAILSTFYEDYKPEYFERLSNLIKYRFGYEIDCYNLSNVKFDWDNSRNSEVATYSMLSCEFIDKKKKHFEKLNTLVFNAFNKSDLHNASNVIIDALAKYSEAESI